MDGNNKQCLRNVKAAKLRVISRSKYGYNDPKEKNYWRCLINEVEKLGKKKANESRIKRMDLCAVLPPKLQSRVSKLVAIPTKTNLDIEEENWEYIEEPQEIKKIHTKFNESTLSEILEQERIYNEVILRLDPCQEKRAKEVRNINWMAEFIKKNPKDRIKWQTKLYKLEKYILEKPVFEQAEETMDRAAGNFADWVNSLSGNDNDLLSKELIKQLFSIEMSEGATAAIHIAPKQVKVLPNEIAVMWNLPKMSLEPQVEKHLKAKYQKIGRKPHVVAFGRTLPISMRPWIPSDYDKELKPVFPEELRTAENIFKGIEHLRSTKALVEYYLKHEKLQRPLYLVKTGSFKSQAKQQSSDYIPLYKYLKTFNHLKTGDI